MSVNFMKNWSLWSAPEAACCRSNFVFANFYLKGVQFGFDSCRPLGTFTVAGDLIGWGRWNGDTVC